LREDPKMMPPQEEYPLVVVVLKEIAWAVEPVGTATEAVCR
jgi:hypothetical protein